MMDSHTKHGKSVRFDSNVVIINYDSDSKLSSRSCTSSDSLLWWTHQDFDKILARARDTAQRNRQLPFVMDGLEQAWIRACQQTNSLLQRPLHHTTLQQIHANDRGLKLWCQYGHSRRGLEKYTSQIYHDSRRRLMNKNRREVVRLSRSGADEKEICRASEQTSKANVIFARMMGVADAMAAESSFLVVPPGLLLAQETKVAGPNSWTSVSKSTKAKKLMSFPSNHNKSNARAP